MPPTALRPICERTRLIRQNSSAASTISLPACARTPGAFMSLIGNKAGTHRRGIVMRYDGRCFPHAFTTRSHACDESALKPSSRTTEHHEHRHRNRPGSTCRNLIGTREEHLLDHREEVRAVQRRVELRRLQAVAQGHDETSAHQEDRRRARYRGRHRRRHLHRGAREASRTSSAPTW